MMTRDKEPNRRRVMVSSAQSDGITGSAVCALDIEIRPLIERIGDLPPPDVKYGNTVDPAKRKAKEDEARVKQIEKMGLNPHFSICATASLAFDNKNGLKTVSWIAAKPPADADPSSILFCDRPVIKAVLEAIWDKEIVVTFSGAAFDIPFLMRRALLTGADGGMATPIPALAIDKYRVRELYGGHCDIAEFFRCWDPGFGDKCEKLHFYAREIAGMVPSYPPNVDKSKMYDLWDQGQGMELAKVSEWDAKATLAVWKELCCVYPTDRTG